MSLDYPNRSKWESIRRTPRKPPAGRMVHTSTNYMWITRPDGTKAFVKVGPGKTYIRQEK